MTIANFSPTTNKEPTTPKWLEKSVERKWSLVPLSMPIDDLVSKCLGRASKAKKARTESRIQFDKNSGHWSAEIAMPLEESPKDALTPQDYRVSKVNFEKGSCAIDMKFFEVSNKKIADRVWKDAHDKQEMKEAMKQMAQYINAILHPDPKPINQMSAIMDVNSDINQQFLDSLQRCKTVAKIAEEWTQDISKLAIKKINLLDGASKEISAITKKVESNTEGHEKERSDWARIVLWLEDVQEIGLQKFLSECPVASLDEKTLYVIQDCIEWRNEAIAQGIVEVKEKIQELQVIDEIIQRDLKWFNKHCAGKDEDSIAQIEELVNETQKKF